MAAKAKRLFVTAVSIRVAPEFVEIDMNVGENCLTLILPPSLFHGTLREQAERWLSPVGAGVRQAS